MANQGSIMEEALLKQNTDCVYFLASPFTCKKGAECEYRHSDMARLNPRDCWYWFSGNCLNPTCAFRHPPLEVPAESSSIATRSLLNQYSAPETKTTVPCYFYLNGYCNKGERCPFLHGHDDAIAWKPKMAKANTISDAPVQPLGTKIFGRSDTETAITRKYPISSEIAVKSNEELQVQQKPYIQQPALNNMVGLSTYADANASEYEETAVVKEVSLQRAEVLTESECEPSDHSTEDLVDGNIVRDEFWESSPGFDVLVNGKTEDMAYENDSDYLFALDGVDNDREGLQMQPSYVDHSDYDERAFLKNRHYDPFEHLDGEFRANIRKYSPSHALDRKVGYHKRKLLSLEFPVSGGYDMDLRDYLRKRRMVDGYMETLSMRHDLVRRRHARRERFQRHARQERFLRHAQNQQLHRRVASKVERNGVEVARGRTWVTQLHHQCRPRNSRHNRSREYNSKRRHQLPAEGQWRSSSIREANTPVTTTFAGPKRLSEIKEEKRVKRSICNGIVDFDSPKPLSEILKDKKKTTSTEHGNMNNGS